MKPIYHGFTCRRSNPCEHLTRSFVARNLRVQKKRRCRMRIYTKQQHGITTNAQRLRRYKSRMEANGFKRLNIWVHPELLKLIREKRQSSECYGRTLERLILGESKKRHGGL